LVMAEVAELRDFSIDKSLRVATKIWCCAVADVIVRARTPSKDTVNIISTSGRSIMQTLHHRSRGVSLILK